LTSMAKPKLFLIDLSYTKKERNWSIIPFPLSIAYMGAYVAKMLPDVLEVRLFKDPDRLLKAISEEKPAIAAFSNYIWNKNLQLQFARHLKEVHPSCLTIMGGPNYNFTELDWVDQFARQNPQIEYHVEGEGEAKFLNIVACAIENNFDIEKIDAASPAGATYVSRNDGTFVHNTLALREGVWNCLDASRLDTARGRLLNLDDIPSPYLTGLLDEFLEDENYCPIIETNRGCPYSCTFCNWGAMGKSKSASFALERVIAELEYISAHNKSRSPFLYIGDANFGLFERDVEIAHLLRKLKDQKGFPQNVYLYYAKNSSEKVVRIAETLKDMTQISLSRQTQNSDVLKNIKRSNISIDTFNSLSNMANSLGVISMVELIYTLPGESKDSFFAGIREIMENNVDLLHFFPAMLLHGSEMGTQKSRNVFGIKGEWRSIDGCAGEYGPVRAMEYEEIITSTNAMSREDHFEVRLFHFLQAVILDSKFYKEILLLTGEVSFVDFVLDLLENYESADAPFRDLINAFTAQAKAEFIPIPPESWTSEDIRAAEAAAVKLNPLYTVKLLYQPGVREAFHKYLVERLEQRCGVPNAVSIPLLDFLSARLYPFDGSTDQVYELNFDIGRFLDRPAYAKVDVSDYILDQPQRFRFSKTKTYQEFIDNWPSGTPLTERLYDLVLHHSHERPHQTLVSRFVGQAETATPTDRRDMSTKDKRYIQLEGGWTY
jgi:radical SAM superfamily enzyme YgiQ (UPF0313 family)